jgi:hypothetical protein
MWYEVGRILITFIKPSQVPFTKYRYCKRYGPLEAKLKLHSMLNVAHTHSDAACCDCFGIKVMNSTFKI